jgi:hypothetical protein
MQAMTASSIVGICIATKVNAAHSVQFEELIRLTVKANGSAFSFV